MNEPQLAQNSRLAALGVSQLQQSTVLEGTTSTLGATSRSSRTTDGAGGGRMDAAVSGPRSGAEGTSESHAPQNAVSATTGAPHAEQIRSVITPGV